MTLSPPAGVTLETETCCVCAIPFAMPGTLKRKRAEDRASFWCPNGHSQSYVRSEADRLREQLQREQAARTVAEQRRDEARAARDEAQRRIISLRGVVTRLKKKGAR